jgi:hypothetical protein
MDKSRDLYVGNRISIAHQLLTFSVPIREMFVGNARLETCSERVKARERERKEKGRKRNERKKEERLDESY